MKKTSVIKSVLAMGMVTLLFTACGTAKVESMAETAVSSSAYDSAGGFYDGGVMPSAEAEMTEEAYDYEAEESVAEDGGQDMAVQTEAAERKLIKTVDISVETEEFDILIPGLQKQVETLGGYIESSQIYEAGSYYTDDQTEKQRRANMTVRVPKEKLEGFLSDVTEQTNVIRRSESVEDVTLQYVDLESHKKALLTEQERLLELLAEAESVEDIIAIEGRLSEVRYQLESMESQLRTYDNKIDYCTVYLSIHEVNKYSAAQGASMGQRISIGFTKSLEYIGVGIQEFAVNFVIYIPFIVLGILLIAAAVFVWRMVRKTRKKNQTKQETDGNREREQDK